MAKLYFTTPIQDLNILIAFNIKSLLSLINITLSFSLIYYTFQTPFTVYQFKKMYTGIFSFMPADKTWLYDMKKKFTS